MIENNFNRVIVSSNDSPTFLNFFPIVSCAWNKFYGISPDLALVTDRDEDDPLIIELSKFGNIHCFPKIKGVPDANNAKLSRFFLACKFPDEVITIEDIDTIPMNSQYVNQKTSRRLQNKLLAVGKEVYLGTLDDGKFPVSTITGEGRLFAKLFNPYGLKYEEAILSFAGFKIFDDKEDPLHSPPKFSDESLIRALIHLRNFEQNIHRIVRDIDVRDKWIDRSWWYIDNKKLMSGGYDFCNFKRPYSANLGIAESIFSYLGKNKFDYDYRKILLSYPRYLLRKIRFN